MDGAAAWILLASAMAAFSVGVESKQRVCYFGPPPEPDPDHPEDWMKQVMREIRKRCPGRTAPTPAGTGEPTPAVRREATPAGTGEPTPAAGTEEPTPAVRREATPAGTGEPTPAAGTEEPTPAGKQKTTVPAGQTTTGMQPTPTDGYPTGRLIEDDEDDEDEEND